MRAEIFSVGTELLLGQIVDTNAQWLAQRLSALGIDLYYVSQIGDNLGRLTDALTRAWNRSDLIIMTGGVGPTEDDLTRETIAAVLGEEMTVDPELERQLRAWFGRRGVAMPERNVKQATLIPSATALPNPVGTAPGWFIERDGRILVAMPGVPPEMYRMWEEQAEPRLRQRLPDSRIIFSHTLKVYGVGESAVEEQIHHLLGSTNPTIATYAKRDGVHVRLTAKAADRDEAETMLAPLEAEVRRILGNAIYGVDDETLPGVVGALLRERGMRLAVMESCTGGLLGSVITDVAGSSGYFVGGVIAYNVEVKLAHGVDAAVIERHGVVSAEVAEAMASAARRAFGVEVGIGVTGAAGPDSHGGVTAGTAFYAVDCGGRITSERFTWRAGRPEFKLRAAMSALNAARLALLAAN